MYNQLAGALGRAGAMGGYNLAPTNDPEPQYYNNRLPLKQAVILNGIPHILYPNTVIVNGAKQLLIIDELNHPFQQYIAMSSWYAVHHQDQYFQTLDALLQAQYANIQYVYPPASS